jgi:uncharacterized membrane protein YccC
VSAVAENLRRVLALGPAEDDHWAALRVGVGVAVPSLLLIAIGRPDLLIYAVFGAFTGMYGRNETHRLRLQHQGQAALMLVAAVGIGVVLSASHGPEWVLVIVECAFAGLASLYSDRVGLRPSGPFFGLFALGACASVPTSIPVAVAILIAATSAGVALVVGVAGWARIRQWDPSVRRQIPQTHPRLNAVSYVIGIGIAGALSAGLHIGHPNWAMAAAAVPLSGAGLSHRLTRGLHRILGTLVGLVVAAAILLPAGMPRSPIILALIIVVLQFPTELFMTRNYGLALVFFTPLILLMTQLANPVDPATMLTDRAVETIGGAIVGMAVAVTIRPRRAREAIVPAGNPG